MPVSSLLAGQGEDTEAPSLFSGPGGLLNVEESPFERLIAQARPGADGSDDALVASLIAQEAAAAAAAVSDGIEDDNRGIIRPRRRRQPNQRPFAPLAPSHVRATMKSLGSSYVTVLAGSLCLLQIFLVWGSFLSNSWVDTYSKIPDLPMNDGTILIHSTTPASILSSLASAQRHGAFLVILLSSLFIPCLCMILCPAWTVTDHGDRQLMTSSTHVPCLSPRFVFESLIRSSYLVVFLLLILDTGTSSIEVVLRNENIVIFSRATGGLVCYTLGIGAALGVVLVLRMSRAAAGVDPSSASFPEQFSTSVRSGIRSLRIPPPRAFQLPWRLASSGSSTGGAFGADQSSSQQQLLLDPLLEDDSGANYSNDLDASTTTTPIMRNLQIEDESDFDRSNSSNQRLHYCQKVILYEVGTLATVLWLPCLFLPLFQLKYDGLASEFMPNVSLYVRLAHFPILLGQKSRAAGTSLLIQWVLGSALVLSVYVVPILATVAAVTAWIKPSTQRLCRMFLLYIHPMLCGIVFVLALTIAVPAFGPVLDHVLQEETSGVCEQIQSVTGEACLTISGRIDLGFWCLLVQSISLELFVLLTILWGLK